MNKTAIKKFAIEARKKLIASVSDKAGMIGITEKDFQKEPVTKGADFEIYKTAVGTEATLNRTQSEQRRLLVVQMEERGYDAVIEEVAYTWFNRICAIRFMEVNDYLPTRVRVLSSEKTGKNEPDLVTESPSVDLNFTDKEKEYIIEAKMNNMLDDLFKMLFIKQCNKLHEILPELFEETEDYTEMLLNISYTNKDDVIYMLVNDEEGIPESDFNVTTVDENGNVSGQVEIIGWLYQYYNTELKDDTFTKLKKNIKITKERIPAATQLFTPDWIVRYMVENSVGRIWIEHLRALDNTMDEKDIAEKFAWKYYLPEAEQETDVHLNLIEIRTSYMDLQPTDIKCIDPCMGSGHILIAMFDVLMDIYKSAGYSERDAAFEIIENNIYGLDVDKRAYQLAYFAVMMKGRGYNRRFFFGRNDVKPVPNVYSIIESNDMTEAHLKFFGKLLETEERSLAVQEMKYLLDLFHNAKEYGSLLKVDSCNWKILDNYVKDLCVEDQITFDSLGCEQTQFMLVKFVKIAEILNSKYHAVVTNPPYMGSKGINNKLLEFVQENYPQGKPDVFATFMLKINEMLVDGGFTGMITPYVWMYLSSFSGLRDFIIGKYDILNLVQLEYNAFEVACVPVCTFNFRKRNGDYRGRYIQLASFRGWENQEPNTLRAINDFTLDYCFECKQSQYEKIADTPIAYWLSDNMYALFINNKTVGDFGFPRQGMATADNARFMRKWYEVSVEDVDFYCSDRDSTLKKWYPHSKGGSVRRWYGNNEFVINWQNDGSEIRNFKKAVVRNPDYYFKMGITWSDLTISWFSARFVPIGFTFDSAGPTFFPNNYSDIMYICGYFNSVVFQELLNISCQGMHYSNGVISKLPIAMPKDREEQERISKKVTRCIELEKMDWDSSEYSWDFKDVPICKEFNNGSISDSIKTYLDYREKCKDELIILEREINEYFIHFANLSELRNKIDKSPCTLFEKTENEIVKELISYYVGCLFGRYSIDNVGLNFAGGKLEHDINSKFVADADGIIPITDADYFEDDIVVKFEEFIKVVFGEKDFPENMIYLSKCISRDNNSPRNTIRNYFIKDFMKDHLKLYQKRPIYWMLDSGKQNGFKGLIYMHRYDADTVGRVRTEYLHRAQSYIETALKSAEYLVGNSTVLSEKSRGTKLIEKYKKQLAEIRIYDEAVAHIASQRVNINLDDGVKANYEKFQEIEVLKEGKKSQKVDLLYKIN